MIEQLWFGWSEVGLEGSNRQQIIAASAGLADPATPLTRTVLRYCYSPTEPTIGWCEADGVRIAFRRTPCGLDGRGRPGNFFVHALAGQLAHFGPGQLPAILAGQLLRSEAPAEPQTTLDRLAADSLALGPEIAEPAHGRQTLAHYLANLADGRLTALRVEAPDAPGLAAYVARHMPASLGMVGFSEREEASASTQYDLTSAPAPNRLFAEADPAVDAPESWQYAAQLLLDAASGNPVAADCVSVLAATAPSRRDFAVALGHWCAFERSDTDAVTGPDLRWLSSEPALQRRAMRLPVFHTIVGLAMSGEVAAGAVLEHSFQSEGMPLVDRVCQALGVTPADGLNGLVAAGAYSLARAAIEKLAIREIDLSRLRLDNQRALLGLFASDAQLTQPVIRLLDNGELAVSIIGDPSWPLAWQVQAARAHGARLPARAVERLLSQRPEAAALLCEPTPTGPLLEQLGDAITELDVRIAERVRDAARGRVPARVDRIWWMSIYQRADPLTRLEMLARSDRDGRHGTAVLAAPACAAAIEWCASQGLEMPRPGNLYRILSLPSPSAPSDAMRNACLAIDRVNVYRRTMPGQLSAVAAVQDQRDERLRSATTELLVWRFLESPDWHDFDVAMASVRGYLEPASATGPRLWRGARVIARRNPEAAQHLVRWTVQALDAKVDSHPAPPVCDPAMVRNLLKEVGLSVEAVLEPLLLGAHTKGARRWLSAVAPARKRASFPWSR